jgi:hypothetical protein
VPETLLQADGYPRYRQGETSPVAQKGTQEITARDVVPYNPYLSKMFGCHLNVEYCGSIRAVKYLYKYTYKGHDRANIQFQVDEVQRYIDARYVGPPESCWRLLQRPMHDTSHTIARLAVHEFQEHSVVFRPGEERKALEGGGKRSTLDGWLKLNEDGGHGGVDSREFRYAEIPEHFVWNRKLGAWTARKRGTRDRIIGRLHSANPNEGQRFYLYLLLLHVRGPTCWQQLVGEGGKGTHQQKAVELGLCANDEEYTKALDSAVQSNMP